MSFLKIFFIATAIFLGNPVTSPAYDVKYGEDYSYNPNLNEAVEPFGYTALAMPDSVIMCSVVDGHAGACWYMPVGSVILIPVPDSAPVDSL